MLDENTETRVRGPEWIFNALYSTCGDPSATKCNVNIPLTFIFKDGRPVKALCTDTSSRCVSRVQLEDIELRDRTIGERGFQGEYFNVLRVFRKLILQHMETSGYPIRDREVTKVCSVWYIDGEREDLSLAAVDSLLRSEAWRVQVLLAQGYTPAASKQDGFYSDAPKVRSKVSVSNTHATDQLARTLAKYAEKSYIDPSGFDMNRILIKEFHANFVLDPHDKFIFIGTEYLTIAIVGKRREYESSMLKEQHNREMGGARSVAHELKELLQHAARRGLGDEESFNHFDTEGYGFIDIDLLITGLTKLGIGVTRPVGEMVLQIIGGVGSNFIRLSDFKAFVHDNPDLDLFNAPPSTAEKSDTFKSHDFGVSSRSQLNTAVESPGRPRTTASRTTPAKRKMQASRSGPQEPLLTSTAELPVPASEYQIRPSKDTPLDLPPWATRRQKAALNELKRAHQHWSSQSGSKTPSSAARATRDAKGGSSSDTEDAESKEIIPSINIPPPSLQAAALSMAEEVDMQTIPDDLLHIDHGVVMSYRILTGKVAKDLKEADSEDLRYRGVLEMRENNLQTMQKERGSSIMSSVVDAMIHKSNLEAAPDMKPVTLPPRAVTTAAPAFTLIIIPDLFTTLDTLAQHFTPLLSKYPQARVILVGLPGLPHTHWPRGWVINADLHARSITSLLSHLSKKQWRLGAEESVFFMSIGTGMHSTSVFLSRHLPNLTQLKSHVKTVISVNGFMKMTKSLKKICRTLRESMLTATSPEMNELVTSLHFGDEYLNRVGRDAALSEFWASRRYLADRNVATAGQGGMCYTGVLEQLRGLLIGPDDAEAMSYLSGSLPLVVVQGTEDVFVDPRSIMSMFSQDNMLTYSRRVVTDMSDLGPNSLIVNWIRSGHEMLQERDSYLLGLVSQLVQRYDVKPIEVVKPVNSTQDELDEIFSVMSIAKTDTTSLKVPIDLPTASTEDENMDTEAAEETKDDVSSIGDDEETFVDDENATAEGTVHASDNEEESVLTAASPLPDDPSAKARKLKEREARKQYVLERRKKEAEEVRKKELEAIHEKQRKFHELKTEEREVRMMTREDKRSRAADEYVKECEIAEKNSIRAREKADELFQHRREEAIKRVEDEMARQRILRLEERRRKAEEVVQRIEEEELTMQGEAEGGYGINDPSDPHAVIAAIHRVLKDLMECKQKAVESMKRQKLVEDKTQQYRVQRASLESEVRKLRQAIQLVRQEAVMHGIGVSKKEVEELHMSLAAKEDTLREFAILGAARESQLDAANRSVRAMKLAAKERTAILEKNMAYLRAIEKQLYTTLKVCKMDLEHNILEKETLRMNLNDLNGRIKQLTHEKKRLKEHKHEFVDSDVLIQGVLQRCVTKQLRKHIKAEEAKEKGKADAIEVKISEVSERIQKLSTTQDKVVRDVDKVALALRLFTKAAQRLMRSSASDTLKELVKNQDQAERAEAKKQQDSIEQQVTALAAESIADKIRSKDSDLRSKEERKFIAIDMILYPNLYNHLSITEMEELRFDPDYQCDLEISDLHRILKLPDQISLALPFLHSHKEVEAHYLIMSFYRNKSLEYFIKGDFISEGTEAGEEDTHTDQFAASSMRDAEIVHDIYVRESRRDRVRSTMAGENLTDDEQMWISMDMILSPHLYEHFDDEELDDDTVNGGKSTLGSATSVSSSSVGMSVHSRKMDGSDLIWSVQGNTRFATHQDGDKYDPLREIHDSGGIVFDSGDNRCPFSRSQLLSLRTVPIDDLKSDVEKRCRRLMDYYYVHEDESVLGQARLQSLHEITSQIADFVVRSNSIESASSSQKTPVLSRMESIRDIERIWGAWDSVHPASAGADSQINYFQVSSYNASRDHPGAYAIHPIDDRATSMFGESWSDDDLQSQQSIDMSQVGYQQLMVHPGQASAKVRNSANSQWFIVDNVAELAKQELKTVAGKMVVIAQAEMMTLSEIKDVALNARQSRSHRFEVPNRDDCRVLEFTVSITFQGVFGHRGYKLGRLAANLFRLPDAATLEDAGDGLPIPVGYAPHHLQQPNLPNSIGRIVILHRPQTRPIRPGTYQLVLGAASAVKYTIEVNCRYAQNALSIVDNLVTEARVHQQRLPKCLLELDDLHDGLLLAERKLAVANQMILEGEAETQRCQNSIRIVNERLLLDDQTMELTEDERRELFREQSILEIEFAEWAMIYSTRCREKNDIKEGIAMMHKLQREKQIEKKKLKTELADYRRDLPACIALLRSYTEAANIAASLNTTVQGKVVGAEVDSSNKVSLGADTVTNRIITPADAVRRQYRREGWDSLNLEQRQWLMLDESLHPQKYEWLREQEEEENQKRIEIGKKPKKRKKYNAAIEAYRMSKSDIERITSQPFSLLTRSEMNVRKLLAKYHDDADMLKRARQHRQYGFDPHLAEKTRSKQIRAMTRGEKEWASLDKVLHPEVWAYYHHDEDAASYLDKIGKEALLADDKSISSKTERPRTGAISRSSTIDHSARPAPKSSSAQKTSSPPKSPTRGMTPASGQRSHSQQQQMIESMGRILNEDTSALADTHNGNVDLGKVMAETHAKQTKEEVAKSGPWKCPFNKEELFRIWRKQAHLLANEDEEKAYKLLHKYNGSYVDYMQVAKEADKRKKNEAKAGAHVQWEIHGNVAFTDIDLRARQVLRELDRAKANKNFWMDSFVLHTSDQRFPTEVLRQQLEEELDAIMRDQIREREKVDRMNFHRKNNDDDSDSSVGEAEDDSSSDEDEEFSTLNKIQKRAARRQKIKQRLKDEDFKKEVYKTRKMILTRNKEGDALDMAELQNELGVGGCLACRAKSCNWIPTIDMEAIAARQKELDDEIERVRADPEAMVLISSVTLSAQLGGGTAFQRDDLLEELMMEKRELQRRVELNDVDKELHDCYNTRKEFVEVRHLHGYATVLWTNNARKALAARQQRLVAMSVAQECVDDILDYMLEGWYFGERQSSFSVAGYVPSVKRGSFVRSGHDQIRAVAVATKKAKERLQAKKQGKVTYDALRGQMKDKLRPVEEGAQMRLEKEKVAKEGTDHYHALNETESTLKFGLFLLTLMYFRAMAFVRREKKSWSGETDAIQHGGKKTIDKNMTDEKRRMLDEESKMVARKKKLDQVLARAKVGENRKREREANERREAVLKLQAVVRRQRREKECVVLLQRLYRGHLGRKAARRWAMKRAELAAINALLNSAAICMQRIWRGHMARVLTKETRAEMAYFIAMMRAQEAAMDDEEYWQTHPFQRFKKNTRAFVNEQFRQDYAVKMLGQPKFTENFEDEEVDIEP